MFENAPEEFLGEEVLQNQEREMTLPRFRYWPPQQLGPGAKVPRKLHRKFAPIRDLVFHPHRKLILQMFHLLKEDWLVPERPQETI